MHRTAPANPRLADRAASASAPRPLLAAVRGVRRTGAARRSAAALLLTALALGACAPDGGDADATPTGPTSAATSAPTSPRPQAPEARPAPPDVPVTSAVGLPSPQAAAPVALEVDELKIAMAVDPVGIEPDGTMTIPVDGNRAGWYRYGPAPASDVGTVVLAAHVDTLAGLGQFSRLVDVEPGTTVSVTDADGRTTIYTVTDVERIAKAEVPLDRVFDRAGERRLVLVTCGGKFDRSTGHYVDNVIVTALPTP